MNCLESCTQGKRLALRPGTLSVFGYFSQESTSRHWVRKPVARGERAPCPRSWGWGRTKLQRPLPRRGTLAVAETELATHCPCQLLCKDEFDVLSMFTGCLPSPSKIFITFLFPTPQAAFVYGGGLSSCTVNSVLRSPAGKSVSKEACPKGLWGQQHHENRS